MKYAICNETFGDMPLAAAFRLAKEIGYTGIEIAPFTLDLGSKPFDARTLSEEKKQEVRDAAKQADLEVIGLHWLLAHTEGFYLTSPDENVRQFTAEYMTVLTELCAQLGGSVMVLGSPLQRNLLPGVTHEEAERYAAEVLRRVMPACSEHGVTIALEPLGPAEGDFLNTAEAAVRLAAQVDSPHCRLHLDVKAMSTEDTPIPDLIRENRSWLEHFHANDPNLLGPGMGEVDFVPIMAALQEIIYDGWVSVEVFDYSPGAETIGRESLQNLIKAQA